MLIDPKDLRQTYMLEYLQSIHKGYSHKQACAHAKLRRINYQRKEAYIADCSTELDEDEHNATIEPDFIKALEERETVHNFLKELTWKQIMVVVMYAFGQKQKTIAKQLGCTPSNISRTYVKPIKKIWRKVNV